ncbi:M14 family zinc carboxypeptidase [Costertonia aggregata]|uniref:Zinc carboxypeptidase n=1 Tax=Costertonia aggregata TaxID=343403 RepID=A0A7H9ASG4_9FLAO|nr:M14 family zinc carboxypeptidase [Costertonia aggregata]QLG46394.1 zinc carboxypeptidase [Costertonia aggregata]
MKLFLRSFFFLFFSISIAQELQSPSQFLGYELGTRFTRHHQVVDYYEYVAKTAPGHMQLMEYGKTNEKRPLLLAYVSSETNMKDLDNIRKEHIKNTTGESNPSKAIVWLSYNVHGNESVSTEASMQTLYELLTSKSDYLENTIVIMDPCINPDGRDRYVNWYNQYKNTPNNIDPNSIEHHEGWWSGRSNHYMFDLNRDWAWLTQVESQQRLKQFNKWLPHVHVDFHEQGVDNPYYFAPAAEPFHEVITPFQREFQTTIGKNHAKYFDANGWFYFTKEVFDLFYPSYGDTYPTYNGGIGMTYEQGGSGRAGLGVLTSIGDTLTLNDRISHHHTTGLSTVEVAANNAEKLNTEFKKFYQNKDFKYKSYVLSGDKDKLTALKRLLIQHDIEYGVSNAESVRGFDYKLGRNTSLRNSEGSLVVSTNQPKGTLVKVLFEPNAKLTDSLTYDITAWSLPYAYGLDAIASESLVPATMTSGKSNSKVEDKIVDIYAGKPRTQINENAYAYITDWNSMDDARFLTDLIKNKIRVRKANKPFKIDGKPFKRGSLIITKADNQNHKDFVGTLKSVLRNSFVELTSTNTGFVEQGKDFGSSYVEVIPDSKVAVLSGEPTSTLRFGEIWHFFEQQLHYPITVIDTDYMNRVDFSAYDILILPDGYGYQQFLKKDKLSDLKEWVANGGKLIAMGGAIKGIDGEKGFKIKTKKIEKDTTKIEIRIHEQTQRENIKQAITGAIFKTKVDTTHPLAYGYDNTYFTLKLGADTYDYLENGNVVYLDADTMPVAGFAGSEAQKKIGKTLIYGVENHGKGKVIYMVDNPLFRGFWENGKLFFANALFMVN